MSLRRLPIAAVRASGLTVVELLVALAVLSIALGVLAATLSSANRAYRLTNDRVERAEATQLVTQVLQYHLRLASYVGADPDVRIASLCGASVAVPVDHDVITVRYLEDRTYGAITATNNFTCGDDDITVVTFDVDGGFLRQNGAPIIGGVQSLEVVAYFDSFGLANDVFPLDETSESVLRTVTGIHVQVAFENGDLADVVVPFVNPQRVFIDLNLSEG